jgi:hypothetical protein
MTVDQCHERLVDIRRKQGTRYPLVRVDCGGTSYRGRLSRSDSDPEHRREAHTPYSVLILEGLGLTRGPQTIIQIANIPDNGLRDLEESA